MRSEKNSLRKRQQGASNFLKNYIEWTNATIMLLMDHSIV